MIALVVVVLVIVGAAAGHPSPAARAVVVAPGRAIPRPRRRRSGGAAGPLEGLPELVDLLHVAAAAGVPAVPAVEAVAPWAPAPWTDVLRVVLAEVDGGRRADDALRDLAGAHDGAGRPLAGVLRAALDDGDALVPGLARLAVDARDLRRRRAEESARRMPVRLLLPLVTCSLPAAAVLTVVPIVAGALHGLRLPS